MKETDNITVRRMIIGVIAALLIITSIPLTAFAETKKADGSRIVGTLTITAYTGAEVHPMPHSFLTFTSYEDMEFDASCYRAYIPNEKYMSLMKDYYYHPENYSSDPLLYNNDDLKLPDRESYFDASNNGPNSEAIKVSLKEGESVTIAASAAEDGTALEALVKLLEASTMATSENCAELIRQLHYYIDGSSLFNRAKAYKAVVMTAAEAYQTVLKTGHNPLDGRFSNGGLTIDRELHDQFVSETSRFPNRYFTVEITADELDRIKKYIADPANNYFSFLDRNCTRTTTSLWNMAFEDRPEYKVNANFTGFADEPESLYLYLSAMKARQVQYKMRGTTGKNFSPRTPVYIPAEKPQKAENPLKVTGRTVPVSYRALKKSSKTLKAAKVLKFTNRGKGTLSYTKKSGNSKIRINKKTGKVTIKKGLKKGKYPVRVKITAAGNANYKTGSKVVKFTIRVK